MLDKEEIPRFEIFRESFISNCGPQWIPASCEEISRHWLHLTGPAVRIPASHSCSHPVRVQLLWGTRLSNIPCSTLRCQSTSRMSCQKPYGVWTLVTSCISFRKVQPASRAARQHSTEKNFPCEHYRQHAGILCECACGAALDTQ
jgi:hypothetical protein